METKAVFATGFSFFKGFNYIKELNESVPKDSIPLSQPSFMVKGFSGQVAVLRDN